MAKTSAGHFLEEATNYYLDDIQDDAFYDEMSEKFPTIKEAVNGIHALPEGFTKERMKSSVARGFYEATEKMVMDHLKSLSLFDDETDDDGYEVDCSKEFTDEKAEVSFRIKGFARIYGDFTREDVNDLEKLEKNIKGILDTTMSELDEKMDDYGYAWTFLKEANAKFQEEVEVNFTLYEALEKVFSNDGEESEEFKRGIALALSETIDNFIKVQYEKEGLYDFDKDEDELELDFVTFDEMNESVSFRIKGFTNMSLTFEGEELLKPEDSLEEKLEEILENRRNCA